MDRSGCGVEMRESKDRYREISFLMVDVTLGVVLIFDKVEAFANRR